MFFWYQHIERPSKVPFPLGLALVGGQNISERRDKEPPINKVRIVK